MKPHDNFAPKSQEQELDDFINALNLEQKPKESTNQDIAELQSLTRKIKNLRPASEPHEEFSLELQEKLLKRTKPQKRFLLWSSLVASILVIIFLISPWSHTDKDLANSYEQTVKQLQNYHGTLEKVSTNSADESRVIQRPSTMIHLKDIRY